MSYFKKIITYALILSFTAVRPAAAQAYRKTAVGKSPQAAIYQMASQGNRKGLQQLWFQGYSLDAVNENGDTSLCVAIYRKDYRAYNLLKSMGVNTNHPCVERIDEQIYTEFMGGPKPVQVAQPIPAQNIYYGSPSGSATQTATTMSAGKWALVGLGAAALIGGGIALAGGGGGGDDTTTIITEPLVCDVGYKPQGNTCIECTVGEGCPTCPSTSRYWNGAACVECMDGIGCSGIQQCNDATNTCCAEATPYYNSGSQTCVGCLQDSNCPGTQQCNTTTNACCDATTPYWNATTQTCVGCITDANCPGTQCNTATNTCCAATTPYWNGTACVECTTNENCPGTRQCQTEGNNSGMCCPETAPMWDGTNCVACVSDAECGTGFVCNAGACVSQCQPGYEYDSTTRTCVMCQDGFVNPTGQSSCIACAVGEFSDATHETCAPCTPGQVCQTCEAPATYWNGSICQEADPVAACAGGYYFMVDEETPSNSRCTKCAAGSFSAGGQPECDLCPAGTYSVGLGAKTEGTCLACPSGSTSEAGSATCTCPDNYVFINGQCVAKSAGRSNGVQVNGTSVTDYYENPQGTTINAETGSGTTPVIGVFGNNSVNLVAINKGTISMGTSSSDAMYADGARSYIQNQAGGAILSNSSGNLPSKVMGMHAENGATAENLGTINLTTNGTATGSGVASYGMYFGNSQGGNAGTITVAQTGGTNALFGIAANCDSGTCGNIYNIGNVSVINQGNGDTYGLSSSGLTTIANQGSVSVSTNGTGHAYGFYSEYTVANTYDGYIGTVTVTRDNNTSTDNSAYGLFLNNASGSVANTGNISVSSGTTSDMGSIIGIYTTGQTLENGVAGTPAQGSVTVNLTGGMGNTFGIYENNTTASSLKNYAGISVSNAGGSIYGIQTNGTDLTNTGAITLTRTIAGDTAQNPVLSNADAIGLSLGNANGTLNNDATVSVTTGSTSDAGIVSGIYSTGNIKNTANGALTVAMNNSGSANVYGIYGTTATNSIENDATIAVTSAGTSGYAVGIFGEGSKITNKNTIDVTSTQTGAGVYAVYGIQLTNPSAISQIENTHKITLTHNGTNAATMYALNANGIVTNEGELALTSNGTGTMAGIYTTGSVTNGASGAGTAGNITISRSNATVAETGIVGIYSTGNVANKGAITINSGATNGSIYGIYTEGNTLTNSGAIQITVDQAVGEEQQTNIFGILGEGTAVNNSGNITLNTPNTTPNPNVNAYGIYVNNGSIQNTGTITIDGSSNNLFGIYAAGTTTVSNSGNIVIKGVPANPVPNGTSQAGNYIVLNGGTLSQAGTLSFEGSLNLNSFGGKTVLEKGGIFKADTLSGDLVAGISLVSEGNDTVYTAENVLQSDDTSGLNISSGSALFDAKKDGNDVVMTMKEFSDVYGSGDLASFMRQNYTDGLGIDMFQTLKSSETLEELLGTTAKETGASLLPNFAQENFGVYRSLGRAMNNSLFADKGDKRAIVAYDMLYQNRKDKGTLTGYDNYANTVYGLFDRKVTDNLSLGGGLSITHFHSSYDDDSSRNELMFQAFAPITYDLSSSVRFVSMPRIGYSFGDYKRYATNSTHEGDIQNITYGVSNEIRKVIPTGFMDIEPAAEFNILGYRQQKIKESKRDGALILDATNYVSVEGGLGLYASKRIPFENSTLGIRMGGAYYHEFADPYSDIDAGMYQMSGGYTLSGKGLEEGLKNKRDRGLLSAKVSYDWRDWSFYASFTQFIENDTRLNANLGASLKF